MEKEENKDVQPIDKKVLKLPEASFKEIPNYTISRAPPLPEKYFDFVEKSQEELDKVSYRYTHKTSGFKTSGTSSLQNVRFSKRPVSKTSGFQKVWLQNVRFSKHPVFKRSGFQKVW
jgi:hypothetical protein